MSKTFQTVYQFKITLKGIKPPIWRRILVPDNITFKRFSTVILNSMGWENCHLHSFLVKDLHTGKKFEITDSITAKEAGMPNTLNENKVKISDFFSMQNKTAFFLYDFGDNWDHSVLLEKILPREEGKKYPVTIDGKRACPPEDIGGVWRYEEFLEIIKDPNNSEYEDMIDWVGEDFDPEFFEIK